MNRPRKSIYYQLVIVPNVEYHEENPGHFQLKYCKMSPQMLIERAQKFQETLVEKVHDELDKFLETFETPMSVTRKILKRWHTEFDLEKCPDIEMGDLPKPPHFEKHSSAQGVFNCSTSMQRALDQLESKELEEKEKQQQNQEQRKDLDETQGNIKNEEAPISPKNPAPANPK
jgi:chromatin licensing and DNA replication factor 1